MKSLKSNLIILGLLMCSGLLCNAQRNGILTSMLEKDISESCAKGFKYVTGSGCVDIDECHETLPCKLGQICRNLWGSYMCKCGNGYDYDERTGDCVDINECQLGYCRNGLKCTNTIGSFICECEAGMTKVGRFCQDVNECLSKPCAGNQYCINTQGSYLCECKAGFEDMGDGSCKDTDECLQGMCGAMGEVCRNTLGAYECDCKIGYEKDKMTGRYCKDVDECRYSVCPSNSECTNTHGSYLCRCHRGYSYVYGQCVDSTECTTGAGKMCQWKCEETPGSFKCLCPDGYDRVEFGCTDVNECDHGMDKCAEDETCINTKGGYECVPPIKCPVSRTIPDLYRKVMKTDEFGYRQVTTNICRRKRCGKYNREERECRSAALSISYHYVNIPSNQPAPMKLFKISFSPRRRSQRYNFNIVQGNEKGYFELQHSSKLRPMAKLIMKESLTGPANYTLKIDVATYHPSGSMRDSRMVTVTVFVSRYEF